MTLSSRGAKAANYVGTSTTTNRLREAGKGRDLISLAVAQNVLMDDLLLPRVEAAAAAAVGNARYAESWLGVPRLREGVARLYNDHILTSGARVDAKEVAIVSSATAAIDALLFAVLERGDAVLTPAPYYGSYARDVEARAECVMVPFASRGGIPTVESLEEHFQWREPRPKALLIASPHNPCGSILSADALRDVVAWTRLRNVHLVVDEVFALSTFEAGAFVSVLDVLNDGDDNAHVHAVWGCSKDLALSGYRVGAVISKAPAVIAAFECLGTFAAASTVAQAVVADLLGDDAWLRDVWLPALRARLAASWKHCKKHLDAHGLARLGGDPTAGHFCLLDLRSSGAENGARFEAAFASAGVVLTPGALMGAPDGVFRLCHSSATGGEVAEAIARVAGVVNASPRPAPPPAAARDVTCKAPGPSSCAQS